MDLIRIGLERDRVGSNPDERLVEELYDRRVASEMMRRFP